MHANLHERAVREDVNEVIFLIRFQVGRCLPQGAAPTTDLTEEHHEGQKKVVHLQLSNFCIIFKTDRDPFEFPMNNF